MAPSSTGSSSRWGGCPKELCRVHQLLPYSEVVRFGDGHGNMMSPPFFLFLFLGGYGAWGFDPPHLLLNGGVACIVATCHAKISWKVLSSDETFQFSHVFWGAPFLNPLCFSFVLTPLISQLLLCLFPWFHYNKMYFQWRKNSSLKVQFFVTKDL